MDPAGTEISGRPKRNRLTSIVVPRFKRAKAPGGRAMVRARPRLSSPVSGTGQAGGARRPGITGNRCRSFARGGYAAGMCRNIRTLYNFEPPATDEEVRAAALQYVRKISGFSKPSQANAAAFERAVDAVAEVSAELLGELSTAAPPKDREAEAAKARARAAQRYAA